ncbi:hypothetical protein [Salinibius halmophilus]|uniref:hypothetical protein n=1 Tax=Salinibius halmophilus TaxID=1853216 RepID=UPI000E671B01|nr:hypothetical protein [Salinibius halmophilus]
MTQLNEYIGSLLSDTLDDAPATKVLFSEPSVPVDHALQVVRPANSSDKVSQALLLLLLLSRLPVSRTKQSMVSAGLMLLSVGGNHG